MEKEIKSTPGPWKMVKGLSHIFVEYNEQLNICILETDDEESEANAELIAQAPDLLAKVKKLEEEIETVMKRRNKAYAELDQERAKVSEQEREIERLEKEISKLEYKLEYGIDPKHGE